MKCRLALPLAKYPPVKDDVKKCTGETVDWRGGIIRN